MTGEVSFLKKYLCRCSASLINWEMQITTRRYHVTPIRTATIKNKTKTDTNKGVSEGVETLEPYTLLAGMENGAATVENSVAVPQKMKIRTTI